MNQELQAKKFASIDKPWLKYFDQEDIERPLPKLTMYGMVKANCVSHNGWEDKALLYMGARETYRELFAHIDQYAAAFQANGVRKGDFVSFLSVSIPETIYSIYALNKIGAVCNFVDVRTDAVHAREYIKKAKSDVLIVLEMAFDKVADYLDELNLRLVLCQNPGTSLPPMKKLLYALKAPKYSIPYDGKRVIPITAFAKQGLGKSCEEVAYEPDLPAAVTRTGGTTGLSKGVVLTNDSLNAVAYAFCVSFFKGIPANSSLLNFLPVGVSYGIAVGVHTSMALGLEGILIPKFELSKFDDYIITYRPNHIIAVPVFYDQLVNSPKLRDMDLSFLVTLASGGDSANESMEARHEKFRLEHHVPWPITSGYGLSETSSAAAFSFRDVHKKGSVGIPAIGSVISVFRPDSEEELPLGERGEVCITGPSVMKEYLYEPEETSHVLWKHADGQTWVHTGDIGYMDEDGFLYIVGRIKRAIIRYDGHKMYPLQIEQVVMKDPGVKRCVVIGVKDLDAPQGHLPLVVVERRDGVHLTHSELRARILNLCKAEIELRSQPVGVEFVDSIPLTNMGKNDYRALEKQYDGYNYHKS